jgi:hypothetical protein
VFRQLDLASIDLRARTRFRLEKDANASELPILSVERLPIKFNANDLPLQVWIVF